MDKWKRQHPAATIISFLNNLKELLVSLVAIFIFGQTTAGSSNFYFYFAAGLLVFSLLNGFVKWLTFRYLLSDQELNIKEGLVFRKKRYIRRDRVQSIDINANLIQRLFGLVELRIETAGGGNEPEFKIVALKKDVALRIKQELLREVEVDSFQDNNGTNVSSESLITPSYRWALSSEQLIIAAATSSGVGIAATFIAVIVSQAPQYVPEPLIEDIVQWFLHSSLLLIGAMVAFILFAAWLFTFITTILKYGLFTIEKKGNDIHISRGVLEKRQLTLYAHRITAVRIVQSPIRQPFDYVSVYVESAGGGRQDEDLSTILVPMCKRDEVNSILKGIVPDFAIEPQYEGLPFHSLRRYVFLLVIPLSIIAGVITYYVPLGWLALILPILGSIMGYWQYKDAGIAQLGDYMCLRKRVFAKMEIIVPKKRIQALETTQTIFQKTNDLYTIHVSILSSVSGKTFSVRHLGNSQADNSLEWYSYEKG